MATQQPPEYHTAEAFQPNGNLPPRAIIIRYKRCTVEEQSVLLTMLEVGDSTGAMIHIRVPRIAAHASVSERTVQRVLWGRKAKGASSHHHVKGKRDLPRPTPDSLIGRGVVQELAPANISKRRASTFAIHVDVLQDDPRKTHFYAQQPLPFVPSDEDLLAWAKANVSAVRKIRGEIDEYARAKRFDAGFTKKAAGAFAIGIARRYGMPYKLATKAAQIWTS